MSEKENSEIIRQYKQTLKDSESNYTFLKENEKFRIIDSLTTLISIIRKKIRDLPTNCSEENKEIYEEMAEYYKKVIYEIEGKKKHEYNLIERIHEGEKFVVRKQILKIQPLVYSIAKTIKLLQSSSNQQISILTEQLFQISELNIENGELIIETIIKKMEEILSNKEKVSKITNIRVVLEQILLLLLVKENLENKNSFFMNLQECRKKKIFTRKTAETIGKNYSLISQFIHGENEISSHDYIYAMNITIESVKLIMKKINK